MRIYIDETGQFVVPTTASHSYSLVLALIIPSVHETELFYDFLRLRDDWPVKGIELKGSSLDEKQTAEVIQILHRYDVLVEFVAINMETHDHVLVDDFKKRQADALLAHLTPDHRPSMVQSLQRLSDGVRKMPNQLFLQAFATMQLLLELVEEATLYYVQRMPEELGDISWVIDRKNHAITQMEEMWSTPGEHVRYGFLRLHQFPRSDPTSDDRPWRCRRGRRARRTLLVEAPFRREGGQ